MYRNTKRCICIKYNHFTQLFTKAWKTKYY